MHAPPPRRTRPRLRAPLCAACAILLVAKTPIAAQTAATAAGPGPGQQPTPTDRPTPLSAADFDTILYPQASLPASISLRASRVYDWTVGPTRHLVLEGDVSATLAQFSFRAQRAALWLREAGRSPDNRPVVQVFAYFDELGEASEASGQTAFNARSLPVRAIVELTSPILITADATTAAAPALKPGSPSAVLLADATAALERSIRKAAGQPEDVSAINTPQFTFAPASASEPPAASPKRWRAELRASTSAHEQSDVPREPGVGPSPSAAHPTTVSSSPQLHPPAAPSPANQPPLGSLSDGRAPRAPEPAAPSAQHHELAPTPPLRAAPVPAEPRTRAAVTFSKPAPRRNAEPIFAKSGTITLSSGDITIISNPAPPPLPPDQPPDQSVTPQPAESAITAVGGVTLLYRDHRGRALQLSAQRAVLFLAKTDAPPLAGGPLPAESIRGIYLEGDVSVSDGTYSIRAPQIFYDLVSDQAVMLDAVFSTYSQERGVPLYVRAREIRQESARQWTAREATFTNSAFENPELAIGASTVTIEQRARPLAVPSAAPGTPQTEPYFFATADHVTIRAMGVPFFYWPTYAGDPSQPILKDLRFENRSGSGVAVRTTWNASQLLGIDVPDGASVDLLADAYLQRGPAIGARVRWDLARHKGDLFAYAVPLDNGTDVLKPGTEVDRSDEFRGIISLQDRFVLDRFWTITAEGSYISDEAFIDAFFEEAGETRREFTNRLTATRREDNTILSIEAKTNFNDFIPSEWLLQSPGYTVSKLPEASYARFADDLLPRAAPGVLTHFHDYRIGVYARALDEVTARTRGFDTDALSQKAFGVSPDESIADALRARGYTEEQVSRLDTRQEVTAKLEAGPVHITPFVAARATLYDNTFASYSSNPEGNDATRIWTAAGARASTTITRIYDGIDSTLLDIHRLRHSVTPSITLWAAGTNVEATDIPAYDPLVDSLSDGRAVRIGIAQTIQTKRGGLGQWVDTDLLKLNTDFIFSSDDTDPQTPLGRFFDTRPEYSALGNYFVGDAAYRLTDATSVVGSMVYDFDTHQQDMSSAGLMISHAPGWSTLVDLRYINPQDSTIVGLWGNYDLGDKYAVTLAPSYDAAEGRFQSMFVQFTRRFSAFQMSVGLNYNDITSETTFGLVIQPYGAHRGSGIQGLGSSEFTGVYSGSGGL